MEMKCQNPCKPLPLCALLLLLLLLVAQSPLPTSQALHSEPLFSQSTTPPPPQPKVAYRHYAAARIRAVALGIFFGSVAGFLLALAFLFAVRRLILYLHLTPIMKGPVVFSPGISRKILRFAVDTEVCSARLLGCGRNGEYYKLILDGGLVVAVKRIKCDPSTGRTERRRLQKKLELLARPKHQNVMSLRAYVDHGDSLSLVYDYVPGGSLEALMKRVRAQQINLGWNSRNRMGVGIAKGLRHLHLENAPAMLHYGLKPSNVMLDEDLVPMLGDCGLARLVDSNPPPGSPPGYYDAPECCQNGRYTDKSDVYSLGMILAVLLTGKDPSDALFSGESGGRDLVRWLRQMQQSGDARGALDRRIIEEDNEEEEMLMALRITLLCLSDVPADRPTSDELVAMLTQLGGF